MRYTQEKSKNLTPIVVNTGLISGEHKLNIILFFICTHLKVMYFLEENPARFKFVILKNVEKNATGRSVLFH